VSAAAVTRRRLAMTPVDVEGPPSAPAATLDYVVDVESLVTQRAEWRDGFDAGLKKGSVRFFNSSVMAEFAFELRLLRALYPAVCDALTDAQHQIGVLEAELDYRAPGWDR
jgi:hypothetical protein